MVVWAVSEHIAELAATNGFKTLQTIDYATYDLDGDKPLAKGMELLAEHQAAKFMARSIP